MKTIAILCENYKKKKQQTLKCRNFEEPHEVLLIQFLRKKGGCRSILLHSLEEPLKSVLANTQTFQQWLNVISTTTCDLIYSFSVLQQQRHLGLKPCHSSLYCLGNVRDYVHKVFWSTNIAYSLIRTRTQVYQGVRNFVYFLNEWSLMKVFMRPLLRKRI